MSAGRVSRHARKLPLALSYDDEETVLSGSAVVDWKVKNGSVKLDRALVRHLDSPRD